MTARRARLAHRQASNQNPFLSLVVVGVLVVVLLAVLVVNEVASSPSMERAQVGRALGDFGLTNLQGQTVHLRDYAGQTVLINAWATWCPPCKAEMPDLNAYYQAHRAEGFMLLAINAGEPASHAAGFAQQQGLAFPVLLDPHTALLEALGVLSFPTSIVVGPDGVVKAIHIGVFSPAALEAEVTPYLMK